LIKIGKIKPVIGMALMMVLSIVVVGAVAQEKPDSNGSAEEIDSVVNWIAANAVELKTSEPGNGFDDLVFLKAAIGDARIVSMGEATHGTREMFKMKHRIFEFLVTEMGFKYFGIEASLPDCIPISDYVLNGVGDPEEVLHGQGFWTWDTEEVLDMIKWMKAYNEGRPDKEKVHFFGYDMQNPRGGADFAIKYLDSLGLCPEKAFRQQYASLLADSIRHFWPIWEAYSPAQRDSFHVFVNDLVTALDNNRDECIAATSSDAWTIARLHASVAVQTDEMRRVGRSFEPSIGILKYEGVYYSIDSTVSKLSEYVRTRAPQLWESTSALIDRLQGELWELDERYEQLTPKERMRLHSQSKSLIDYFGSVRSGDDVSDEVLAELTGVADDIAVFLDALDEYAAMPAKEPNVRDRCMADNIEWMLKHVEPGAKIMLWAHNLHVTRVAEEAGYGTMGNELEIRYGDEHFVVGFLFNKGFFQAAYMKQDDSGNWIQKLKPFTDGVATDGSFEATFAQVGKPLFMIDLRKLPSDGPVAQWFSREHPMRNIGAAYREDLEQGYVFEPVVLPDNYDAVIFMDSTSAAIPNRLTRERFDMD